MTFTITLSCVSDAGDKMQRTYKGVEQSDLAAKVSGIISALDMLYYGHFDLHIQSGEK